MEPLLSASAEAPDTTTIDTSTRENTGTKKSYEYYRSLVFVTVLYVVFLTMDGVSGGILFQKYEEIYSQYLNQATAFMYMIMSTIHMVFINMLNTKKGLESHYENTLKRGAATVQTSPTKQTPWYFLVIIGVINGTSNTFLGIGMPNTALLSQSLLGTLSLPVVLILSYIYLNVRGTSEKYFGATLILAGTLLSSLHSIINKPGWCRQCNWESNLLVLDSIFAFGNVGLGVERVFEDFVFKRYRNLHPMKMFQWTMYTQFILYLFFLPTQHLKIFGGVAFKDIPGVMVDGVKCTFGISSNDIDRPRCDSSNTYLFFAYCFVDFYVYFIGLYVIKKYGSSTMAVASALQIPIQQAVYCSFLVGKYIEQFYLSDLFALILVLVGYYLFEFFNARRANAKI